MKEFSMAETAHIFVYGLLTFPDIVTAITGQQFQMIPAELQEHRRYGLSQNPGQTPVPVLIFETGARQFGQLLLDVDAASIAKLDYFEELDSGLYLKKQVRVQTAQGWLSAFCYVAGPTLAPYASGEWQPEQVSAADRLYLIEQLIPQMLAAYAAG
jgi:gamma-glutamylcyclotransferase (GGCT)/AIG2-like uncharacterized protein YtfP